MGLLTFTWALNNWKIEWSSQTLCLKFSISPLFQSFFISFQNKTQRFHCITLLCLSIYVVSMDPHQGNKDVMPFLLPITKAFVEFIDREKTRAYLQCIYCKVKQCIQRELSHTMKSRYAYVWIYGGYIWWLILILLCSLRTYLSFEFLKYLLESRGYLIHLFFQAGI
jgi:hypothetical protein